MVRDEDLDLGRAVLLHVAARGLGAVFWTGKASASAHTHKRNGVMGRGGWAPGACEVRGSKCSLATRSSVRITVRRPGRHDAVARAADAAIVWPHAHHRRCVDAVGEMVWAGGGGVERCRGAADAAVDGAGALLVVGFLVLLWRAMRVSLVVGSGAWVERDAWGGERERVCVLTVAKPT